MSLKTFLSADEVGRLNEIKDEIKSLTQEAYHLVRGTTEEARSKAYWYGHIMTSIDDDHEFLSSRGQTTLESTIEKLRGPDEESEEE